MISKTGYLLPIKSKMSFEEAKQVLNQIRPKPNGRVYTSNKVDLQYDL